MSAVTTEHLIRPHGGVLVERSGERPDDVDSLEAVTLASRELADRGRIEAQRRPN